MWVNGAFRKLAEVARWVVRLAEEVDRGVAVGRGYAPVGNNIPRERGWVRASGTGRRGAGGRA